MDAITNLHNALAQGTLEEINKFEIYFYNIKV